jgi:RNA polymerase sigma-70 factor (ECF subfamily)
MGESPPTRVSLLVRLRDRGDEDAWRQFVQLYAALIYGFARKRGLQDADAADLVQEVLRSVAGAVDRLQYDPRRGTFRGWLYTITRNKIHTFLSGQRRRVRGSGDPDAQAALEEYPGDDGADEAQWDHDYERRLFEWAVEKVRGAFGDGVWQAFWQTAVEGKAPKEVARALGMSVGSVYVAKSRVLAQVKEQIQQLQEA